MRGKDRKKVFIVLFSAVSICIIFILLKGNTINSDNNIKATGGPEPTEVVSYVNEKLEQYPSNSFEYKDWKRFDNPNYLDMVGKTDVQPQSVPEEYKDIPDKSNYSFAYWYRNIKNNKLLIVNFIRNDNQFGALIEKGSVLSDDTTHRILDFIDSLNDKFIGNIYGVILNMKKQGWETAGMSIIREVDYRKATGPSEDGDSITLVINEDKGDVYIEGTNYYYDNLAKFPDFVMNSDYKQLKLNYGPRFNL